MNSKKTTNIHWEIFGWLCNHHQKTRLRTDHLKNDMINIKFSFSRIIHFCYQEEIKRTANDQSTHVQNGKMSTTKIQLSKDLDNQSRQHNRYEHASQSTYMFTYIKTPCLHILKTPHQIYTYKPSKQLTTWCMGLLLKLYVLPKMICINNCCPYNKYWT